MRNTLTKTLAGLAAATSLSGLAHADTTLVTRYTVETQTQGGNTSTDLVYPNLIVFHDLNDRCKLTAAGKLDGDGTSAAPDSARFFAGKIGCQLNESGDLSLDAGLHFPYEWTDADFGFQKGAALGVADANQFLLGGILGATLQKDFEITDDTSATLRAGVGARPTWLDDIGWNIPAGAPGTFDGNLSTYFEGRVQHGPHSLKAARIDLAESAAGLSQNINRGSYRYDGSRFDFLAEYNDITTRTPMGPREGDTYSVIGDYNRDKLRLSGSFTDKQITFEGGVLAPLFGGKCRVQALAGPAYNRETERVGVAASGTLVCNHG